MDNKLENLNYNKKLEKYAMVALQGILANDRAYCSMPEMHVKYSIIYAEELIKQLEENYKK